MQNIQETLLKYKQILLEKNKIEKELYPYLKIYYPHGDIEWSIITHDNKFEWAVQCSCRGELYTEYFSVSLDFFDNPEQYIAREKELNRVAEEEKKEKERLNKIEQEKELLAKLKEKYDD